VKSRNVVYVQEKVNGTQEYYIFFQLQIRRNTMRSIVSAILNWQNDYSLLFLDVLHVVINGENCVNTIFFENKSLKKIPWLKVINPLMVIENREYNR
jgi:hypothetical protein